MYNALPLHLASHHIIATTSLALFQTTPHSTSHHLTHFISHQHLSRHTIPLYNTIFEKSHHIGHIMHRRSILTARIAPHFILLTYHITLHSMYSTPHQFQITPYIGHIIYASHHHISHHILHNIAPHFTCSPSCIIPPHLTDHTPNSTSHCHVSHNIPHHRSVHHH